MSARAERLHSRTSLAVVAPVAAGGLLLVLRLELLSAGLSTLAALACLYCALGLVSATPALRARSARLLPRSVVTVMGVGAFALVSVAPWQTIVATPERAVALFFGIAAAVAEEAFFRRLLFDRLLSIGPAVAIGVSAAAFALVHVPLYGASVLWVDLGAGLLLSWQRWAAGTWGPSAATHAFANALAVIR